MWYNYYVKHFPPELLKEDVMTKKGKIVLAVSVSLTVVAVSAAAASFVVCKRIYEKKYFSVN